MRVQKPDIPKTDDRWTRWALFLGITIWFADLNAVYALPSLACIWGWFSFSIAGLPGLVLIEAIISLVSLILIAFLIYMSWKSWLSFRKEKPIDNERILQDTEQHRQSLMAFVSMLVNGFFFLMIVATFVPIFALNACARG